LEISEASATISKLSTEVNFFGIYFSAVVQLEELPHEKRNKLAIKMLPKMICLFITAMYRFIKEER
jgi:hypothetical protein